MRLSNERLLAQAKAFDNLAIPIRVPTVQIIQQPAALIDHHDQTAPGCMIFYVGLEVCGQVTDPLAQKCNLDFRRSRVLYFTPELLD